MNDKFDELTKSMAQSLTRRGALKKFGAGLAGMVLASFGLVNKGHGETACLPNGLYCTTDKDCCSGTCQQYLTPAFGSGHQKVKVRVCVP
jgi:hypothetical protein